MLTIIALRPYIKMHFSQFDCQTLFNIFQWRRDVRHFLEDQVPDNIIKKLQQAMAYAPSVGNSRPWRVFNVSSQPIRKQVFSNFERANKQATRQYDTQQAEDYQRLKLEGILSAPVQLAVFTDTNPTAGHGLGRQTIPFALDQSTAMAVQNLNLAARAYGLGVGMVTILEPKEMETLFKVPPAWRFSFYLCIGWPKFSSDLPLLHTLDWQKNQETEWLEI